MTQASTAVAIAIPVEVEKALSEFALSADGVTAMWRGFAPHFQAFDELRESAKGIPVNAPKAARALRLELKAIRVAAERTRKDLKEDGLRRGKAIDGINAILEMQLVPIEKAMDAIEKAEEIAEASRKAALKAERAELLLPFADPTFYDLGNMPVAQWGQLLAGAKAAHQAAQEAAEKAEADRIAAEQAAAAAKAKREAEEAAERERMRAENERLARIAEQERAAREQAEAAAETEREEAKLRAKVEREKREALEAEIKAKADAEAKRIAADKAAERKALAAPDKQKLTSMAAAMRVMPLPSLTSDAGLALRVKIAEQVAKFASWLEAEAGKL